MKEIKLASGAKLKVLDLPFVECKALFHAFLREAKSVHIARMGEVENMIKDIVCTAFSSAAIDDALKPVLERCTYNGVKINDDVFENPKAREDYIEVCYLVAEEALKPFTSRLYAKFKEIFGLIEKLQA